MAMQIHTRNYETSFPILLCPMIDARRMEVYDALYNETLTQVRDTRAEIIHPESLIDFLKDYEVWFGGDGSEKCESLIKGNPNARFLKDFYPSAKYLIKIAAEKYERGEFENVAYFEPFYLKDFVAGIPKVKGLR